MGTLTYIKTLIKDPAVASVTPSSRFAVQRVCSFIDFPRAALVVEYGPGLGVFTQYLLGQMGPQGRLVAIEKNHRRTRSGIWSKRGALTTSSPASPSPSLRPGSRSASCTGLRWP